MSQASIFHTYRQNKLNSAKEYFEKFTENLEVLYLESQFAKKDLESLCRETAEGITVCEKNLRESDEFQQASLKIYRTMYENLNSQLAHFTRVQDKLYGVRKCVSQGGEPSNVEAFVRALKRRGDICCLSSKSPEELQIGLDALIAVCRKYYKDNPDAMKWLPR